MTITKLGHCCLYIEHKGLRILTDPGSFTAEHIVPGPVDVILITHEHGDHFHVPSVTAVLAKNPDARVICNRGVGTLLNAEGIKHEVVDGTSETIVSDVPITAHDGPHAEIFDDFGQVQNTGYFIDNTLFYPGDAYTEPAKHVEVLALPVSGPWCRVKDVITYLHSVAPAHAFPVHDGLLNEPGLRIVHNVVAKNCESTTTFHSLRAGELLDLTS